MKKITIGFLTICLLLNTFFVTLTCADNIGTTEDAVYIKAAETLAGLNIVEASDKQPTDKVTRAEFADIVVKVLYRNSIDSDEKTETKKFLGYTNDPVFKDVEGWIWNENDAQEQKNEASKYENATPFRDVLSTNKYWESIRIAARLGLMVGDVNRYFRPNDGITLKEAEKVLLYACGRATMIGDDFDSGIIREASKTGITS